jgi:hypothetical protein
MVFGRAGGPISASKPGHHAGITLDTPSARAQSHHTTLVMMMGTLRYIRTQGDVTQKLIKILIARYSPHTRMYLYTPT